MVLWSSNESGNHAQISQHCDTEYDQDDSKERHQQPGVFGDPHENKCSHLWCYSMIVFLHMVHLGNLCIRSVLLIFEMLSSFLMDTPGGIWIESQQQLRSSP